MSIHIRLAQISDAASILVFMQHILPESARTLLMTPEEMSSFSVADEEKFIASYNSNKRAILLLALNAQKDIIGIVDCMAENKKRLSHVASLGISIKKEYRGQGIGKALMKEVIDWAHQNPWIEKINLKVHTNNYPAISLYKNFGFEIDGCEKSFIKYGQDDYSDVLMMSRFTPFELYSKRLIMRPHTFEDCSFMVELNSDPEVVRYLGGEHENSLDLKKAQEIVRDLRQQFEEQQMGRFLVYEKESGEKIGWCGLKVEEKGRIDLGYRFFKAHWGKGYATEASKRCLQYGFKFLEHEKITARIADKNERSLRVVQKLGMKESARGIAHKESYIEFELSKECFKILPD